MHIIVDGREDVLFCNMLRDQIVNVTFDQRFHLFDVSSVPLPEQEPAFTVYDDIRQKLIAQGMPADQIAFIHEANTEVRKKELFSNCLLYTSRCV